MSKGIKFPTKGSLMRYGSASGLGAGGAVLVCVMMCPGAGGGGDGGGGSVDCTYPETGGAWPACGSLAGCDGLGSPAMCVFPSGTARIQCGDTCARDGGVAFSAYPEVYGPGSLCDHGVTPEQFVAEVVHGHEGFLMPHEVDTDYDGDVDFEDLLMIITHWTADDEEPYCDYEYDWACHRADVTCDGKVDFLDLLTLTSAWGTIQ